MKMKTAVLAILVSVMMLSCNSSDGQDVSKDPKYADLYNQFFFPTKTVYYYDYTNSKGKSGKMLSAEKAMPNAKLIEEIQPSRSRLIVTKVLEVAGKKGAPITFVEGRLHKDEQSQPVEFKAVWDDVKRVLKK